MRFFSTLGPKPRYRPIDFDGVSLWVKQSGDGPLLLNYVNVYAHHFLADLRYRVKAGEFS